MITVAQIREHLLNLLDPSNPSASIDEFDEWLTEASWNMHQDSDQRAQNFVSVIELLLAEFDAGQLSDEKIRQKFADLVREYSVFMSITPFATASIETGTSMNVTVQDWPFVSFDSQLVGASS